MIKLPTLPLLLFTVFPVFQNSLRAEAGPAPATKVAGEPKIQGPAADSEKNPDVLPMPPDPFRSLCIRRALDSPTFSAPGDAPGWLFLKGELVTMGEAKLWQDPSGLRCVPVITKFRESLSAKGVTLILAPVPLKCAVYPEKLAAGTDRGVVPPMKPMLDKLQAATGAVVVDLEAAFRAAREQTQVFCGTDSHWSPAGAALAADAIVAAAKAVPGVGKLIKSGNYITGSEEKISIMGDLATGPHSGAGPEELTLQKTGTKDAGNLLPVPAADSGPAILMGDSHTMVFTDGASRGMHCQGAGLRDQLQGKFGFPLVQISNQNSGGTGARRVLTMRQKANPDYLNGTKVIIWVFSARELVVDEWR